MAESQDVQELTINVRYDIKKHFRLKEKDMAGKPNATDDAIFSSYRQLLDGLAKVECPTHNKTGSSCEMGKSADRRFVEYHVFGCCCDGMKDAMKKAFPYHPLTFF